MYLFLKMEQYFNTILSSILSFYLPITDIGTKIACSMALSHIIIKLLSRFIGFVTNLDYLYYLLIGEKYVTIDSNNPIFEKILTYLYKKYSNNLISCKYDTIKGKNIMILDKLNKDEVIEYYIDNDIKYKIKIKLIKNDQNSQKTTNSKNKFPNDKLIKISSNCTLTLLEKFINNFIKECNDVIIQGIDIYSLSVEDKKNRYMEWNRKYIKISKTTKNTIVSNEVKTTFYDDIDNFINNEDFYIKRGLPYKRTYLLYGEPGCGKTSLIKAIANEYKLPIFIVDLNMFEENNELTNIINDINIHIGPEQKYLLIFEDIDRCKIFDNNQIKKITDDCILNILDGIDESYGRITIMTTNDLEAVNSFNSLVRPGRIDNVIKISYCDEIQIKKILIFYFELENIIIDHNIKLEKNIIITPAKLIQLIHKHNKFEEIIILLNTQKNFNNYEIESSNIKKI